MPKRRKKSARFRLPPEANTLAEFAINNLKTGGAIKNEDGSISTVRSGSVNDPRLNNGHPTLIPFIWGGRLIEDQNEAVELAVQSGLKFPMFMTHPQATRASQLISSQLPNSLEEMVNFQGLNLTP